MRVRTIRKHGNAHPPQYEKNFGRIYELRDAEAQALIDAGLVEEAPDDESED